MNNIESFCLKNGIFYLGSEIYGGIKGIYDYGYLGKLLKQNFENLWRKYFLGLYDNFWEVEPSEIMHKNVFVASGHLENFNDPITECKKCKKRYRADKLLEELLKIDCEGKTPEELYELIKKHNIKCQECGGELSEVKWFNLMFPVVIGPSSLELVKRIELKDFERALELLDDYNKNTHYLRPETAQGPYILFKREFEVHRRKLPLGLAVIGKAFRNEISPRQMLIRLREFTQAELQIFFDPEAFENEFDKLFDFNEVKDKEINVLMTKDRGSKDFKTLKASELLEKLPKFYVYFLVKVFEFYTNVLKIPNSKIRFKELSEEEKAFYNKFHFDVEYYFDCFGEWKEIAGVHYRTDHDLSGHEKVSKELLRLKKTESGYQFSKEGFVPHVLELSFGVDRNVLALIDAFYDQGVFKLPYDLAPIKFAVLPLVSNNEAIVKKAKELYKYLRSLGLKVVYEEKGSIGKRYNRLDEIGVYYALTIDYETIEDDTFTIRHRDTKEQKRITKEDLKDYIKTI